MLLRKMRVQDAARNLRDERCVARQGEAHRLGKSAGDAAFSQLGDRRHGAGGAGGDSGRPGKLPDTVGAQMPRKANVGGLCRVFSEPEGPNSCSSFPSLSAGEFHRRRLAAQQAPVALSSRQPPGNTLAMNQARRIGVGCAHDILLCIGETMRRISPKNALAA